MTVQLPKIETSENRLLTDSHNQNSLDRSFEENLEMEKARLGLLFSPLSQFDSLFAYSAAQDLNNQQVAGKLDFSVLPDKTDQSRSAVEFKFTAAGTNASQPQVFESIPSRSLPSQTMQDLLTRTGWLTPNLEARPLFAQAFSEGKLQATLDLQSLVDDIVKQSRLVKEKGKTELSMTLKPAELGEIMLTLSSASGLVSILIQASPETKKLISDQRTDLENALKKMNINFDQIKIEEVKQNA